MSKMRATAPPCRFPPALHRDSGTVSAKVVSPRFGSDGSREAERGVTCVRRQASKYYFAAERKVVLVFFLRLSLWRRGEREREKKAGTGLDERWVGARLASST
jgi:hypothetical protein